MENIVWVNVGLALVLITAIGFQGPNILKDSEEEAEDAFVYITSPLTSPTDQTDASRKLATFVHTEFSSPEVIDVADNVHVAIGFALGNSIMVEGDDGLIIVDTTENPKSMKEIMAEFRKISMKPVKAIIITHFHTDHVTGVDYILKEGQRLYPNETIEVYAQEMMETLLGQFSLTHDVGLSRTIRQFGIILPRASNGGFRRHNIFSGQSSRLSNWRPTVTFKHYAKYTVAGVTFELFHNPGETEDHLTAWFPQKGVLMPGDNIYKTFPNLYAIRGTPARDLKQWYRSLDNIRKLKAVYMVPSHTRPVEGAAEVDNTLLIYRDAIKYVHDQTVRLINKGYLPGEIVKEVRLPDNVASHPFLQEHYGTVEWSVRGVFSFYLGWFSGDAVDLQPLDSDARNEKFIKLVTQAKTNGGSGLEIILQQAQKALKNSHDNYLRSGKHISNDDKWALELADLVLKSADVNSDLFITARVIRISALNALSVESISSNGRNYYHTVSIETSLNRTVQRTHQARVFNVLNAPINDLLDGICLKVKGLRCQQKNFTVLFEFSDLEAKFVLTLRNSVCDSVSFVDLVTKPDVIISMTSQIWRLILVRQHTIDSELEQGSVKIRRGSVQEYNSFMECFDAIV